MDFPLPDVGHDALKPFWDAVAARRLVFPRCTGCGAFCWYPRVECPDCGNGEFLWTEVSGPVRLFTWAIVRRALHAPLKPLAPYIPVILEFDAAPGVRLVSRWIGTDADALAIGQEVRIVFEDLGYPNVNTGVTAPLATTP